MHYRKYFYIRKFPAGNSYFCFYTVGNSEELIADWFTEFNQSFYIWHHVKIIRFVQNNMLIILQGLGENPLLLNNFMIRGTFSFQVY